MTTLGLVFCFVSIIAFFVLMRSLLNSPEKKVDENRLIPADALGNLTPAMAGLVPHTKKKREAIGKELIGAGYYHSNALDNYLAKRNCVLLMIVVLIGLILAFEVFPGYERYVLIAGVCVMVFAYGLPRVLLSSKSSSRTREIEYNLPDAMDMIAMAIEGGLPLEQSIERVAGELSDSHPSLSKELRIISRQTKSGSLQQAMQSFAERVSLPDVIAWSTLMRQSQQLGGKIVDSLLDYADRIRMARKLRAEQAGNTASVKLLLPVVLCLAPPIFILLVGPAVLDFRDFINRERQESSELIEQARAVVSGDLPTISR